jgi:hypothetical protein
MKEDFKKAFGNELAKNTNDFSRTGSIWTAPLKDGRTYAVMFEYSDIRFIPKTVSVYCGIYSKGVKPIQDLTADNWSYIKFPYKIHHRLFEIPGAVWFKKKVGFPYWLLLMQQKKMQINNAEQIKYSIEILLPYAAKRASDKYYKIRRQER